MIKGLEASVGNLADPRPLSWLIKVLSSAGLLSTGESKIGDADPGTALLGDTDASRNISAFVTDSRVADKASVFVALKGERADGHDFIESVAGVHALAAIVSKEYFEKSKDLLRALRTETGITVIPVNDPLAALQAAARAHLKELNKLIKVGVTGSNGKTTTKDLIASILSQAKKCAASPGNQNSVIGLPLAAFQVGKAHEVAVFEMAMSEKGEMARLAGIVFPDLAVITNIGLAHIGNIGSQHGIAHEKKQIFSKFDDSCRAFLPAADQFLDLLEDGLVGSRELYGESATPGYKTWEPWNEGQTIVWKDQRINLRLLGQHNRLNALAAIQVAVFLGYDDETIREGLEAFKPSFGRSEILRGPITIVQDCYNANPDSMRAAIDAFMEMPWGGGRRVMILGDMKELGADSTRLHMEIGEWAVQSGADTILFFGSEMRAAYQAGLKKLGSLGSFAHAGRERLLVYCDSFESLEHECPRYIGLGDLVLLKASRGMTLERITPVIQSAYETEGRKVDV